MIGIFTICFSSSSMAAETAVVFSYRYIDNTSEPEKNITLEQFKNQLEEIKRSKYNVLPLSEIVTKLKNKEPLPNKTIAIAFKETNKETLDKAMPLLNAMELPFTIFFASDFINSESEFVLNSDELSNIYKKGIVDLGILPSDGQTLIGKNSSEIAKVVNKAIAAYTKITGEERPELFAYPEGSYSNDVIDQISSYNFKAAMTENAGALDKDTDFNLTPSFAINKDYNNLDRFINSTYALPLHVTEVTPQDTLVKTDAPIIGFTLGKDAENPENISCFASDIGKLNTTVLEEKRIEIRLKQPLISGRTSINCTLPVRKEVLNENEKPWKCFSMMLIK